MSGLGANIKRSVNWVADIAADAPFFKDWFDYYTKGMTSPRNRDDMLCAWSAGERLGYERGRARGFVEGFTSAYAPRTSTSWAYAALQDWCAWFGANDGQERSWGARDARYERLRLTLKDERLADAEPGLFATMRLSVSDQDGNVIAESTGRDYGLVSVAVLRECMAWAEREGFRP